MNSNTIRNVAIQSIVKTCMEQARKEGGNIAELQMFGNVPIAEAIAEEIRGAWIEIADMLDEQRTVYPTSEACA